MTYDEVDLVLRRAVEIEHGSARDPAREGGFDARDVEQLASEIGVSPGAVRQAIQEVRTRALVRVEPAARTWLDRVYAPATFVVEREVRGPRDRVAEALSNLLRRQLFRVRRNFGHRVVWEPGETLLDSLRRALDFSREYELARVSQLDVAIVESAASDDRVDVRIVVDMAAARRESVRRATVGGTFTAALTAAGGAALTLAAGLPAVIVAAPVIAGLAAGGAVAGAARAKLQRDVARARAALELQLDRVEQEPDAIEGAPEPAEPGVIETGVKQVAAWLSQQGLR